MSSLTARRFTSQGRTVDCGFNPETQARDLRVMGQSDSIVFEWTAPSSMASYKLTLTQASGVAAPALLDRGWPAAPVNGLRSVPTPSYAESRLAGLMLSYFQFFTGQYDSSTGLPIVKPTVCTLTIETFDRDGNLLDTATATVVS